MRYRGEDLVKIRSENGKIENFQGFVAKSLKIWPIFLKKSTEIANFGTLTEKTWKRRIEGGIGEI